MKKIIIFLAAALLAVPQTALGWGKHGHQIVIAVAQRHLTEKTKENLSKYFDYDIKKDAVWMDTHRNDKDIAYTTAWHVYNVGDNHEYDPNPRLHKGDCIHALYIAKYNLSHYKELSDSAVVMNVRMLIHFAGDMHCPTHCYFPGPRCFWPCTMGDSFKGTFHGLYDKIPSMIYPQTKPDDVAAAIDNCSKAQIKAIVKGNLLDWARSCGDVCCETYRINPFLTEELDPETVDKSREMVDIQLRNAGYRLAYLLNLYFGR